MLIADSQQSNNYLSIHLKDTWDTWAYMHVLL